MLQNVRECMHDECFTLPKPWLSLFNAFAALSGFWFTRIASSTSCKAMSAVFLSGFIIATRECCILQYLRDKSKTRQNKTLTYLADLKGSILSKPISFAFQMNSICRDLLYTFCKSRSSFRLISWEMFNWTESTVKISWEWTIIEVWQEFQKYAKKCIHYGSRKPKNELQHFKA